MTNIHNRPSPDAVQALTMPDERSQGSDILEIMRDIMGNTSMMRDILAAMRQEVGEIVDEETDYSVSPEYRK